VDAIPPHLLRQLVQERVEAHIDWGDYAAARAAEESEREVLEKLVRRMQRKTK